MTRETIEQRDGTVPAETGAADGMMREGAVEEIAKAAERNPPSAEEREEIARMIAEDDFDYMEDMFGKCVFDFNQEEHGYRIRRTPKLNLAREARDTFENKDIRSIYPSGIDKRYIAAWVLRTSGFFFDEIANVLDYPRKTVMDWYYRACSQLGISLHRNRGLIQVREAREKHPKGLDEWELAVWILKRGGMTKRELCTVFRRPPTTIMRWYANACGKSGTRNGTDQ